MKVELGDMSHDLITQVDGPHRVKELPESTRQMLSYALFHKIAHGDENHREWLRRAVNEFFLIPDSDSWMKK